MIRAVIGFAIGLAIGVAWADVLIQSRADHQLVVDLGLCRVQSAKTKNDADARVADADARLHHAAEQLPVWQEQQRKGDEQACEGIVKKQMDVDRDAVKKQMDLDRANCVLWWRGWQTKR